MTAPFDPRELRRLCKAAGPAEHWGTGDELAAYLGTHRDAIAAYDAAVKP